MRFIMKFILRILFAPIYLVLTLFIWICSGILHCTSWIFGIAGTVLGILGVIILITESVTNGIIILIVAALASPVGLPMVAVWLLSLLQSLRYKIGEKIY